MSQRLLRCLALAVALLAVGAAPAGAITLPPLPGGLFSPPAKPAPRPSRPPVRACPQTSGTAVPGDFTAPVFACDFPDPAVLRAGGAWYAYGTATGWERRGRSFPMLRSTDLKHWRRAGDALASAPRWARGDMWAPAPIPVRRGYVLYFTALRRHGRVHCLVAATARRAVGPFRVRRTLSCGDRQGRGYIDPAPVRDPRGRIHLYFSVDGPVHDISVFRLARDGLHLGGRRHVVVRANRGWHRNLVTPTVEGPSVVRRGRRYYLFYSAGAWESDYRMGYAVGTSPTGPFRDQPSSPILRPGGSLVAPGGGTVFTGPGGRPWLAYHAWTGALGYRRGGQRTLRMAPLRWRGDRVTVTLRR